MNNVDTLTEQMREHTEAAEFRMETAAKVRSRRSFEKQVALQLAPLLGIPKEEVLSLWKHSDTPFERLKSQWQGTCIGSMFVYPKSVDLARLFDRDTLLKTQLWKSFEQLVFDSDGMQRDVTVAFRLKSFGLWCLSTEERVRATVGQPRILIPATPGFSNVWMLPLTVFAAEM